MTTSNPIAIECQSCGATGEVLRVTSNLQCRCGSTDLDLWDGQKTASDPYAADRDYMNQQGEKPTTSNWYNSGWAHGHQGLSPQRPGNTEYLQGHSAGQVAARNKTSAAHGPGTGWGSTRPDAAANWNEYAGPTPGYNPKITEKNDSDDSHKCPVCNGTGHDPRASGGGYEENTCRNCHGTGKVVYPTENDTPSLDAHTPSGPQLGGGTHGHYSSVAVPSANGTKVITASQSDKIMTMASVIVENNSGLTTQEAFELARRAVTSFPEDGTK